MLTQKIGFIGQGWIGKNYANDFEARGFSVVRYSLEEPYIHNKSLIADCDIVFIAVPTPTKDGVFDYSIVEEALMLLGQHKTAVIKSTLLPGTTKKIQYRFPYLTIIINPEFLSVATASHDASYPTRNIIGIPSDDPVHNKAAEEVMRILPQAPFSLVCDSSEAELIKYARNCIGYARVLMANIFYDISQNINVNYDNIKNAIAADPDNGPTYVNALHKSGRGAGGECFIKDFAAFAKFYEDSVSDTKGVCMLKAMEEKNIELLKNTKKDLTLLKSVYGNIIL